MEYIMNRSVNLWQLFGFAVTSLGGTLLHYLYDLSGGSALLAVFSGVNESTFEHMKLLFFPMLFFAVVQSFYFSGYSNFWCIKLRGILLGLILIPVIFYTYNGAIGKSPDYINIAIFFVTASIVYFYETRLLKNNDISCTRPALAIAVLCLTAVLFGVFTFITPEIGLFRDPLTGTYGI